MLGASKRGKYVLAKILFYVVKTPFLPDLINSTFIVRTIKPPDITVFQHKQRQTNMSGNVAELRLLICLKT